MYCNLNYLENVDVHMHGSSWYTTPNKNIVLSCLIYHKEHLVYHGII